MQKISSYLKGHIVRVLSNYQEEVGKHTNSLKFTPFDLYLKKYIRNNGENLNGLDTKPIIFYCFKLLRYREILEYGFDCDNWQKKMDFLEKFQGDNRNILELPEVKSLPLYEYFSFIFFNLPPTIIDTLKQVCQKSFFQHFVKIILKKKPLNFLTT